MTDREILDKAKGSIVGGAVGDALGYAVEFYTLPKILKEFGHGGIREYRLDKDGVAEISDDTQMTLFTADGILSATEKGRDSDDDFRRAIRKAYECWYATQTLTPCSHDSWLMGIKPLWQRRAPGCTCMSALEIVSLYGEDAVRNDSKGCGGVMRVAPIGVYAATHPYDMSVRTAGRIAGIAAEITHKHPLSTYSSMAQAMIVAECVKTGNVDRATFREIITDRVFPLLEERFPEDDNMKLLGGIVRKAMALAEGEKPDVECIFELGEGWVAEETLAIAVFSVMRYIDDFERCVACAVNHGGDSDSTGAVAGNQIGAILGYSRIPEKFKTHLELHDVLVSVAEDLSGFSDEDRMAERYDRPR